MILPRRIDPIDALRRYGGLRKGGEILYFCKEVEVGHESGPLVNANFYFLQSIIQKARVFRYTFPTAMVVEHMSKSSRYPSPLKTPAEAYVKTNCLPNKSCPQSFYPAK